MCGSKSDIKTIIYPEEKYGIVFNMKNGFFLRKEFKGTDEPFSSLHGPELIDISITNWCDKGCTFCYKESSVRGNHMSLEDFECILSQAKEMDCLQVALGGGNPNQHPDFVKMIQLAREKYGIVPSYTTNGRGLSEEIIEATALYCGSAAISFYDQADLKGGIEKFNKSGIKPNIHVLLDSKSVRKAIELLKNPPSFVRNGVNAIVFLNYKPVGRGINADLLAKSSSDIVEFFTEVEKFQKQYKVGIGFDSCSASGIRKYLDISEIFVESCESARFSMYIDENLYAYPCSFMINSWKGVRVTPTNLLQIWLEAYSFMEIRKHMRGTKPSTCHNGCPVFPEIDF